MERRNISDVLYDHKKIFIFNKYIEKNGVCLNSLNDDAMKKHMENKDYHFEGIMGNKNTKYLLFSYAKYDLDKINNKKLLYFPDEIVIEVRLGLFLKVYNVIDTCKKVPLEFCSMFESSIGGPNALMHFEKENNRPIVEIGNSSFVRCSYFDKGKYNKKLHIRWDNSSIELLRKENSGKSFCLLNDKGYVFSCALSFTVSFLNKEYVYISYLFTRMEEMVTFRGLGHAKIIIKKMIEFYEGMPIFLMVDTYEEKYDDLVRLYIKSGINYCQKKSIESLGEWRNYLIMSTHPIIPPHSSPTSYSP